MTVKGEMKLWLALWIILVISQTTLSQLRDGYKFKTSICNEKNGSLLPMFGTCQGYLICNNGNAVVGSCNANSRFNPNSLRCEDAAKVDCPFELSEDDEENDADDLDNEEDVDSYEFEELPTTPRPITTVKPTQQQKTKPSKDFTTENLCFDKRSGATIPKSDSCTDYYVCRSKMPQLRHCPGKQHFSRTHYSCMKASEAKCSLIKEILPEEPKSSPTITAGLCPDEKENSLVPHRSDCSKFMLCSNMMFLVMECPTGLHFNAAADRCDYPKLAQCDLQTPQTKKIKNKQLVKKKPKVRQF